MKNFILIFIIVLILIVVLITLFLLRNKKERYLSPDEELIGNHPTYPGDDVMMYALFPNLTIKELANFAGTDRYNYNLVQRFLKNKKILLSLEELDSFIFFKGDDLRDIFQIFNRLYPNSVKSLKILGEDYLTVDKRVLPVVVDGDESSIINHPLQIFINTYDPDLLPSQRAVLSNITIFEDNNGEDKVDTLRYLTLIRPFRRNFGLTNRGGRSGQVLDINIDYPFVMDWDEGMDTFDVPEAIRQGKMIYVYTGDDIFSKFFKAKV